MRVAERAEQIPVLHGQPESRSTAGADPVQRSVAWSRKLTSFATGISFRPSGPRHPLCSPLVAAFWYASFRDRARRLASTLTQLGLRRDRHRRKRRRGNVLTFGTTGFSTACLI